MKWLGFIVALLCGIVVFSVEAQEKMLEDISVMEGVEITYISKSMLASMGQNSNVTIDGLNISKIAKDLTSLQVLSIEQKSVAKVRNKLKSVKMDMEIIMKIKDDDECTEMYGVKSTGDSYSKLILSIDEGDEITIIYMTGNIGTDCFNELSKKTNMQGNTQKKVASISGKNFYIDLSNFDWSNSMLDIGALYGNSVDDEIEEVDKEIERLYEEISKFDDEVIGGIDKEIYEIGEKINKAKTAKERDKLYEARNKLFEKRSASFEKRNEFFKKRNKLFEKRNKLFKKRNVLLANRGMGDGKQKSKNNVVTIYRWDSNKKDFSVADGNVDLKWINKVEQMGIIAGYNLNNFAVEGTEKEIASVQYRIKELCADVEKKDKVMAELRESGKTDTVEYLQIFSSVMDYTKRAYMLTEFYNKIYYKMNSEAK